MGKRILNILEEFGNKVVLIIAIVMSIIALPFIIIIGLIYLLYMYLYLKVVDDVAVHEDFGESVKRANGRGCFSKRDRLDHYKVHKFEHLDHLVYDNDTENWYNSLKKEQ